MTWFGAIFIIPQRYEIVNGLSPFNAAVRFIPFCMLSPVASVISPVLAKAAKVPFVYLLIAGAIVQIIGYGLLGTLPSDSHIRAREYGYQVLAGFGCGMCTPILTVMVPFTTEKRDHGEFFSRIPVIYSTDRQLIQIPTLSGCHGSRCPVPSLGWLYRFGDHHCHSTQLPAQSFEQLLDW